jgi:DHA1 family bicyclomycin/chloramphenicol resistance-like MFS transporter
VAAPLSSRRARPLAHEGESSRGIENVFLFLIIGFTTLVGAAAMDVYLPGLPGLATDLHVSSSVAQLTITTFLIGLGVGQLVAGPLSDVVGRRLPIVAGVGGFTLVSLLCAAAPNIYALAAMRLFQGLLAAAGVTLGRAIVRDLTSGASAARYLSRLMLIVGLGPILAPVIGGQLLRVTSWRGVFVALSVFGVVLWLVIFRWLPETLPPDRRVATGLRATARSFSSLFDRRFVGLVGVIALSAGALFGYIAGSAFVLEVVYSTSPQVFSFIFALNALCLVIGAQVNAHLLHRFTPYRLLGAGIGILLLSGVLLVLVVGSHTSSLLVVVPPISLLAFSWGFIPTNGTALALTDHPRAAGSAASVIGVCQSCAGALAAPLVGIGGRSTAMPFAVLVLTCGILGVIVLGALVKPTQHAARRQVPAVEADTVI